MGGNYSHTTRSDGLTLTAAIYNADHQNHIDNMTPAGGDDYSSNATQMQSTTSPGTVGGESLATSLAGELERLRYVIKLMHGGAQWYPGVTLVAASGIPNFAVASNLTVGGLATIGNVAVGSNLTAGNVTVGSNFSVGAVVSASISGAAVASQAVQETGTAVNTAVPPGRQHFHPSAAKAWVKFDVTGTIGASYNISSVTDNGTGDLTVVIATDFSSGEYGAAGICGHTVSSQTLVMNCVAIAAGTFQINTRIGATNSVADTTTVDAMFLAFFGDQA